MKVSQKKIVSIKYKLSIWIALVLIVFASVSSGISAFRVFHELKQTGEEVSILKTKEAALYTSKFLSEIYHGIQSLAQTIETYENFPLNDRRKIINAMIESVIHGENSFTCIWTGWEPNALDGFDDKFKNVGFHEAEGRYIACWTKVGTNIVEEDLDGFAVSDWYIESLKKDTVSFLNPNFDKIQGKMTILGTVSIPIKNSTGKKVGVLGIDFDLSLLSQELSEIKIYKTGFGRLLTEEGIILSDPNSENIGQQAQEFKNPKFIALTKNAAEKNISATAYAFDPLYKGETFKVLIPLKLPGGGTWFFASRAPISEIIETTRSIIASSIAVVIVGAIIISIFVIIIVGFFIKPLVTASNALQNIANGDGDLTVTLTAKGSGEIAELSAAFNKTMEKIRLSVLAVSRESSNLKAVGEELSANMIETANAVNEITATIASVKNKTVYQSSSVSETEVTMGKMVQNLQLLEKEIESQSSAVVESSASVEEMVSSIRSVTEILRKNSDTMQDLSDISVQGKESTNYVNEMVNKITEKSMALIEASSVIQNIASQTNLLAMNAAIEAAHAGDSGKGFAVVADEIRKLAEESNLQGKQIDAVLKDFDAISREVKLAGLTAEEVINTMGELVKAVDTKEKSIMDAMQEQEIGSKQVLDAMSQITDLTVRVRDNFVQILDGSTTVQTEMAMLANISRETNESMNEMAAGTNQITKAITHVSDLTHKNSDSISELINEVLTFKV